MGNVIVLGFRPGIHAKINELKMNPIYLSPVYKPGMDLSRDIIIDDIENAEKVIRAVERLGNIKIDGVITGHEDGIFCASILRAVYNTPGDKNYLNKLYFRDKILQKSVISKVDKTAKYEPISAKSTYDSIVKSLGSPFVIKPSNGMTSKKTYIIENIDLFEKIKPIEETSLSYMAESFSKGEEYFVDGIWENGNLVWFSIGKYASPIINTSMGESAIAYLLTINQNTNLYSEVEHRLITWLSALRTESSVFHLEFFKDESEYTFGECASRIAGGLIPELINYSYGINLYEVQIKLSLEEEYVLNTKHNSPTGFLFFQPSEVGMTKNELIGKFDFIEIDYDKSKSNNNLAYNNIGYGIVTANSSADLLVLLQKIDSFSRFKN